MKRRGLFGLRLVPQNPPEWVRLWGIVLGLPLVGLALLDASIAMPGESHQGPPGPLPAEAAGLPETLRAHVDALATRIGPRNEEHPAALSAAEAYLTDTLRADGYLVTPQAYPGRLHEVHNLIAERPGREPGEIVVVGAHYDTVDDTPGADDNASGCAALLALAHHFATREPRKTLRFVAWVNEEPPTFQTPLMGSVQNAQASRAAREKLIAVISLESIGFYDDRPGSQSYPPPLSSFYPDRGNFISFVGNLASRPLVTRTLAVFREHAEMASEGASPPGFLPGVGWSDQWGYWREGYPAMMVTDTAPFRNPAYHLEGDTAGRLDYLRMGWVVFGLEWVLGELVGE